MAPIEIPALEVGTTRLFALSLTDGAAQELRDDPAAQAQLLGVGGLNPAGMEVFRLADLGQMGLMGYLRDGVDAREEDLARDRQKLSALGGWVMLAHSSAFGGAATQLALSPEATLIGTYRQQSAFGAAAPLDAEAARPYTGTPKVTPPPPVRGPARGVMGVVGLLVLTALLIWWALG